MIVCIPFYEGDSHSALRLLNWIHDLGGVKNHWCKLIVDPKTPYQDVIECAEIAQESFGTVDIIPTDKSVQGWIPGSCELFKKSAQVCADVDFLFLEPDATPLRATWLDEIETESENIDRMFIGSVVSHNNQVWPNPYFEGVGVYKAGAWGVMKDTFKNDVSWTRACASVVIPRAYNSPLFQHLWGEKDNPPTFKDQNIPGTNVFSLKQIKESAALFHRCKDGSLIDQLRKKAGLFVPTRKPELKVVSLRRAGDIIALIPLLKKLSDEHDVKLIVHQDFVPLVEGTSYITPIPWNGDWEDPLTPTRIFGAVNAQVFGKGVKPDTRKGNFASDAWSKLGHPWNRYSPLVFDRRSADREQALADSVFKTDKPKILVKLHGFSSPFPHTGFVMSRLQEFQDSAEIVVLDNVKAERLFDLLGLMDRASCLVSADTVTLWLARASKVPMIMFANGNGYGGSPPVGNTILRIPYSQVMEKWNYAYDLIKHAVNHFSGNGIVHVFSSFKPSDPVELSRTMAAQQTWSLIQSRKLSFTGNRNGINAIRDSRDVPFVKDMINEAFATGPENICLITNNDIEFIPGLQETIVKSCDEYGCFWSYRLNGSFTDTDEGADCFGITRRWWNLHQHLIPDFLLGYWWWDDIMIRVMRWSGCNEQMRMYHHTPHPGVSNRLTTPGQAYNVKIAEQWLETWNEKHLKPKP